MTNILDRLPRDILLRKIYPHLGYIDRLSLNSCLKLTNTYKKLKREEIIRMDIKIGMDKIKKGLIAINKSCNNRERYISTLNFVKHILPANILITQFQLTFRNAVIDKMIEFSDPTNPDYALFEQDDIEKMQKASQELSTLMEHKYPYKHNLVLNTGNTVLGLLPPIVWGYKNRGKIVLDIFDGRTIIHKSVYQHIKQNKHIKQIKQLK